MEKWKDNVLYEDLIQKQDFRKSFFKQLKYDIFIKEEYELLEKENIF